MKEYLESYHDIYFLHEKIKEIDPNYELVFNKKTKAVEVHNFNERGTSFVTKVNFLDARLIDKLIKTRRENIKKFLEDLERENLQKEQENLKKIKDKAGFVLEEVAKYSFSKNRDLNEDEFQKILKI